MPIEQAPANDALAHSPPARAALDVPLAPARGLRVSSFLDTSGRGPLHALFGTAAALELITTAPELSEESRQYLLATIEQILLGHAPRPYSQLPVFLWPVLALARAQQEQQLRADWGLRLIQAARRDVHRPTCPSWSDLMLYCRYAAEPLGRAVLELQGVQSSEAERGTDALCAALLVLRRLRQMGTDWREHGRCYIPTDWFAEAGGTPEQLVERRCTPATRTALTRVLQRVEGLLAQAADLPSHLPSARLRGEAVRLLTLAHGQVRLLQQRDPLRGNIKLPLTLKIKAHLRGWLAAR